MINNKKVLALTPARGGSKGLPGKNIKDLCGQPLLSYPIETAKASSYIDRIIVSTDCPDIAQVAYKYNADVSMRAQHLATDTALVSDTIRELLNTLDEKFDYLVLLEATAPLRTTAQVNKCIETIITEKADSVATFSKADPAPTRLWKLHGNTASTFLNNADPGLPRQQQKDAYYLNGLVYVFDIKSFLESETNIIFFGKNAAVITNGLYVDIDTLEDFTLAEHIMRTQNDNTI